jgi:hypothetical protein
MLAADSKFLISNCCPRQAFSAFGGRFWAAKAVFQDQRAKKAGLRPPTAASCRRLAGRQWPCEGPPVTALKGKPVTARPQIAQISPIKPRENRRASPHLIEPVLSVAVSSLLAPLRLWGEFRATAE